MKDYKEVEIGYYIKIGDNYLSSISAKGVVSISNDVKNALYFSDEESNVEIELFKVVSKLKLYGFDGVVIRVEEATAVTYTIREMEFVTEAYQNNPSYTDTKLKEKTQW